jgi:hypothetical protein
VILIKAYQDCFQKWQQCWEQCINAGGEYFEGDKAHSVAGMSEKIIKKILPKLFEQITYMSVLRTDIGVALIQDKLNEVPFHDQKICVWCGVVCHYCYMNGRTHIIWIIVLSCVWVTIDGVWIGNWIYWPLTDHNNK